MSNKTGRRILQIGNAELMQRRAMNEICKGKQAEKAGDKNSVAHHGSNAELYQIQSREWINGEK